MEHIIKIHNGNDTKVISAEDGSNLLDLLRSEAVNIEAPCGGNGTCGKCRIKVEGHKSPAKEPEQDLLGEQALSDGYRLACYLNVSSDLDVYQEKKENNAVIMTERKSKKTVLNPIINKRYIKMNAPDIEDQRSDFSRISSMHASQAKQLDLKQIRKLPVILRENDFNATMILTRDVFSGIEAGDTSGTLYGIAVDIGTTTIASYLMDLNTGEEKGVHSCMNPQRKYGADVISRISYTIENEYGLDDLNREIITCLNESINILTETEGIGKDDVYTLVAAGNTTMTHLLMGIPPENLAAAPFIPVTTDLCEFNPDELGIGINEQGSVIVLPAVSAYIGSDITAAALAAGMHDESKISLLVDIGTNGEVILGNKDWLYACSVAAGPAFEGAHIKNGVGGISGAIDTVEFADGIICTTIENKKAVGICGSGIVDTLAGLLSQGIVDETGRIIDEDEMPGDMVLKYSEMIEDADAGRLFKLVDSSDTETGSDIVITQRDIREVQNAKAAIAAGINTLIQKAGISADEIDNVYLAGGFGSYLNINSSLRIGLLPFALTGKIEAIGNAAGSGAVEVLLDKGNIKKIDQISTKTRYVELSADKDFVDRYIDSMIFDDYDVNVRALERI